MSDVVRPGVLWPGRAGKEARLRGAPSDRVPGPRPFQASTDPDLLWLGRSQKQILDRLRSAVLAREGVLLLTGDVGTGKTILTKALLRRLRADAIIASVMYVGHSPLEFLKDMGGAFGADGPLETTEAFYRWLPTLLDDAATQGKRVLLCVDEAQSLDQELLTELGRLASVAGEPRSQARLSILLVGQSELNAALSRPENAALAARAGVRCVTEPLTGAEIGEYVAHQLKIGGSTGVLFTERGLQELAAASQGIPRLVNTLADLALLSGSKHGTPTIGAEVVRRCALGYPRGRADRSRFGLPARPRPGRPRAPCPPRRLLPDVPEATGWPRWSLPERALPRLPRHSALARRTPSGERHRIRTSLRRLRRPLPLPSDKRLRRPPRRPRHGGSATPPALRRQRGISRPPPPSRPVFPVAPATSGPAKTRRQRSFRQPAPRSLPPGRSSPPSPSRRPRRGGSATSPASRRQRGISRPSPLPRPVFPVAPATPGPAETRRQRSFRQPVPRSLRPGRSPPPSPFRRRIRPRSSTGC
jgi:type II secretory pathway predicted ATPase ExeA